MLPFKPVLELPLDLRGGWIKPRVLNDYMYAIICLIWGPAGSWEFPQGGVGCRNTYVQSGRRLPETCLPWQHTLAAAPLEDHQPSCTPGVGLVTHCKHRGKKYRRAVGHTMLHPSYLGDKSTWRCSRARAFFWFPPEAESSKAASGHPTASRYFTWYSHLVLRHALKYFAEVA